MNQASNNRDEPLLEVSGLGITLATHRGLAQAVRDVSFSLARGEAVGLIGESGSGKSLTALALMGLLPQGASTQGSVNFAGTNLLEMSDERLCAIRGERIAMIFQEPMTALNPVHTIGAQVAEPLRLHRGLSAREAREAVLELLDRVGIPQPAKRVDAYPHQFSGGQRQRITIAMALACKPDLLIADEPTTALDVTVQQQILDLIADLVDEHRMSLILISHDLGVISQNVDRMLVMYGGSVVESGSTEQVFEHMAHPYTRGLLAARPRLAAMGTGSMRSRLNTIPGTVPELVDLPPGCPFAGRCSFTTDACWTERPPAHQPQAGHIVRCLHEAAMSTIQPGAPA